MFSYEQIVLLGLGIILAAFIGLYLGFLYGRSMRNSNSLHAKKRTKENHDLIANRDENQSVDTKRNDLHIRQSIIKKMESLRIKTEADFLGLAIYDVMNEEIRWRLAVGSNNSRYKRIVIRMGKGIAGEVIQLNRTIKIEDFPHDVLGDPIEYPILLVEHLRSVIAVPVKDDQRIYGVLLIGQRKERKYTNIEEDETKTVAEEIAKELATANIYIRILHDSSEISIENQFENINDSLFVQYLMKQEKQLPKNKRGQLHFEVLDQSIIEIPNHVQEILMTNMEEILKVVNQQERDRVSISIVRDEGNLLIECTSNRSISSTKQVFENIYQRIGEIGGSIISYHEEDSLYFVMQLPISDYKNPLSL